jgi:hypothetical protein
LLHHRIALPQLPRRALMRTLLRNTDHNNITAPHMCLLASALYNSATAPSACPRPACPLRTRIVALRMSDRIRNCIAIASHISLPENSPFTDPKTASGDLTRHLCTVALSSRYCLEYMYMPPYYEHRFVSFAEVDKNLEAALLVACGYTAGPVLHTMSRLLKEGILPRYHTGGTKRFLRFW